jgi:hypothetical protein
MKKGYWVVAYRSISDALCERRSDAGAMCRANPVAPGMYRPGPVGDAPEPGRRYSAGAGSAGSRRRPFGPVACRRFASRSR